MRELLAALSLLSLPLPPSWTVVVNGQPLRHRAVLVQGQTYLPLDALRGLGVSVTFSGREIRLGPALHHGVPGPTKADDAAFNVVSPPSRTRWRRSSPPQEERRSQAAPHPAPPASGSTASSP